MNDREMFGKIAYEAYCDQTGGVSLVSNAKLPTWEAVPMDIKMAWCESALAVVNAFVGITEFEGLYDD